MVSDDSIRQLRHGAYRRRIRDEREARWHRSPRRKGKCHALHQHAVARVSFRLSKPRSVRPSIHGPGQQNRAGPGPRKYGALQRAVCQATALGHQPGHLSVGKRSSREGLRSTLSPGLRSARRQTLGILHFSDLRAALSDGGGVVGRALDSTERPQQPAHDLGNHGADAGGVLSGDLERIAVGAVSTFYDAFFLASFLFILLSIAEALAIHTMHGSANRARALRLRSATRGLLPLSFVLAILVTAFIFLR